MENLHFLSDVENIKGYEIYKETVDVIKQIMDVNEQNSDEVLKNCLNLMKIRDFNIFFFIDVITTFANARPKNMNFVFSFFHLILNNFPDKLLQIQNFTKNSEFLYQTLFTKGIFTGEEKPDMFNGEETNISFTETIYKEGTLEYFIKEDDFDSFQAYTTQTANFDFNLKIEIDDHTPPWYSFDSSSISIIDFAAFYGSVRIFKYLLLNNSNLSSTSCKTSIAGGDPEIIHIIEQRGLSFTNCFKNSLIYHRYELSDWLLMNFSTESVIPGICIRHNNLKGFLFLSLIQETPISLSFPSFGNHILINQYLIEQFILPAETNIMDYRGGQTPLHICTMHSRNKIISYLVQVQHVNIYIKDDWGADSFTYSSLASVDTAELYYREFGCNKNINDKWGASLIHYAARNNNKVLIHFFSTKCNVALNAIDMFGFTILHIAVMKGFDDLVSWIFSVCKECSEQKDFFGCLPLHYASIFGYDSIASILINKYGTNPNVQNNYGNTPLHFACKFDHFKIASDLINIYKATVSIKNNNGETPLDIAKKENNSAIISLFN